MATPSGIHFTGRLVALIALPVAIPIWALWYLQSQPYPASMPFATPAQFSLLVALATLTVLALVCSVVVRKTRKIRDSLAIVEEATRQLMRGDYAHRIELEADDSFHSLASAFNQMTDQIEASVRSNQSVADIDQLILSDADLDTVLRKVLLTARRSTADITLILRQDQNSLGLSTFRLEGRTVHEQPISLLEISEDILRDEDGYRRIAKRVCGRELRACIPVAADGRISGVLVSSAARPLTPREEKQLRDLADRLSVAITNKQISQVLYQKAHFDDLTGLINRHAFEDRLRTQISRSWRGEQGALLFIDLDGFKKVNDTEGHKAGDRLLVEISERLKSSLREVDTIARLGGDEFAIIVPGCEDEKSVSQLCERLISSLVKPIVVDRMEHSVGASIGVALFPDDGRSVEELVMKADSAMYRAKETGRAKFEFFDDDLNEANRHRVLVESRLRGAIKRQELSLHFQPKLRLSDQTIHSAEALLRWTDGELGTVTPDTFVPIAEETNLIHEFARIQVDAVASLFRATQVAGVRLDDVAINASAKQVMTDGFAMSLLSQLDRHGLPHHCIEVEVTESVFAQDTQLVVQELEILQAAGIRIALDDFGTGFSSLNMLRELPLDVVKIDRSFVTEVETSEQARVLVRHLISIATTLGKEVVAEGVETEIQLHHLKEAECHYVQGYLVSPARAAPVFVQQLREWQHGDHTLVQAT